MYELPIFPLNTVLFPGMPLQLHIFEPRYRQMIQRCIDEQLPFGVVLIWQGQEANDSLPMPYPIGCSARIVEIEKLADGRMNLTALGEDRFQIKNLSYHLPYLSGYVENMPLENPYNLGVVRGVKGLAVQVREYLMQLKKLHAARVRLDELELPEEPLMQLYLAAALLQIPSIEKQPVLSAFSAMEMLEQLQRLYRRESALLEVIHQVPIEHARRASMVN